jgi:hypothetical protein
MPDQNALILFADLIKGGSRVTSAFQQNNALKLQDQYEQNVFKFNSAMATSKAKEALILGNEAAGLDEKRTAQELGRATAVAAGSGTLANQGTNEIAIEDQAGMGAHQALLARLNAERESLAFETQATQQKMEASLSDLEIKNKQRETIWSGMEGGLGDVAEGFKNLLPYPKVSGLDKNGAPSDTGSGPVDWGTMPVPPNPFGVNMSGDPFSVTNSSGS